MLIHYMKFHWLNDMAVKFQAGFNEQPDLSMVYLNFYIKHILHDALRKPILNRMILASKCF